MPHEILYGINTLNSLLEVNAGKRKIYEIIINSRKKDAPRVEAVIKIAREKKIPVNFLKENDFTDCLPGEPAAKSNLMSSYEDIKNTQGVIAVVSGYNFPDIGQDLKKISENNRGPKDRPVFAILDGITDEGNFGAILRNCSAFGIDGVIIPSDRSAGVNSRVSRISSGALEEVKVYKITNIVRVIEILKNSGFWIYGTSLSNNREVMDARRAEYIYPAAIVFGNEEKGIGRLIEKNCDVLVKIGHCGRMQSLNVAVSAGIMFYIMKEQPGKYFKKSPGLKEEV
jgi:23S rRNA (guanosine2251-2'-O)-methyltransferase